MAAIFFQNIIFTFWWKNNAVYFVMTFGCTCSMFSFSTRLTLQNKPNMLSNPRISFDFQRMKFLFLRGGHRGRSRSRFTENETVISHSSSFTTFCVMEQNHISRQYYKKHTALASRAIIIANRGPRLLSESRFTRKKTTTSLFSPNKYRYSQVTKIPPPHHTHT